MSEEVRTHTAVHVVKGAVQSALGAKLTTSTHVSGNRGRLTVSFDRKPSEEELARVESLANDKVSEGAEVLEFEMERAEAEGHFGQEIYDLFPVPQGITRLKIVRIPEWNINCCAEPHLDSTSSIGTVRLTGSRFRSSRKELELEFEIP